MEESQKETEMIARAETQSHLAPGQSVIEFDEVAAADADSQVIPANQDDSIHSRPTVPGKPKSPAIRGRDDMAPVLLLIGPGLIGGFNGSAMYGQEQGWVWLIFLS